MQSATTIQETQKTVSPLWRMTALVITLLISVMVTRFVHPSMTAYLWTLFVPLIAAALTGFGISVESEDNEGAFTFSIIFYLIFFQGWRLISIYHQAIFGI